MEQVTVDQARLGIAVLTCASDAYQAKGVRADEVVGEVGGVNVLSHCGKRHHQAGGLAAYVQLEIRNEMGRLAFLVLLFALELGDAERVMVLGPSTSPWAFDAQLAR